jgi:flagellar biosynthetic protein FliR
MQNHLFITEFLPFFLVACRIIGLFISMPFLGQIEISGRFRLFAALGFAFLLTPALSITVDVTMDFTTVGLYVLRELFIGYFIGIVGKTLLTIMDITGAMISTQIGLSSATILNPGFASQGARVSLIMVLFGTAIFLAFDLHHLMFRGLVQSYNLFPINKPLMLHDMTKGYTQLFSRVFWVGIQLSAPFTIVFIIIQVCFGLMNRMIPQMQIFFVSLPFQIWAGLTILLITGGAILISFGKTFDHEFRYFFRLV